MSLKSWFDRKYKSSIQAEQINSNDSRAHSNAYHRFFSGYTEVKKVKQGGRGYTIDRIYTGQYYHRVMRRRKSIVLKCLYTLMTVAAAALFVLAAVAQVETNGVWYVVVMEALSIAAFVWMCTGVGNYIFSPEKMTIYEYNSSSGRIRKASLCASITLSLTLLASVYWLAHNGGYADFWIVVVCIAELLGSAALVFSLNRIEHAVTYEKVISEMNGKVNGIEIK